MVSKANAVICERDKLENERKTKKRHLLRISDSIDSRGTTGKLRKRNNGTNLWHHQKEKKKPCPGLRLLNLHPDTTFGVTNGRRK
jgi:hypothetical protein